MGKGSAGVVKGSALLALLGPMFSLLDSMEITSPLARLRMVGSFRHLVSQLDL